MIPALHGRLAPVVASTALLALVLVPTARAADAAPGAPTASYVVQYDEDATGAVLSLLADLGVTPVAQYTQAIDGVAVDLTVEQAARLSEGAPGVDISEDPRATLLDDAPPTEVASVQAAPPWGLDRMDQADVANDSLFVYPSAAGRGVTAYVVDTGVAATLAEFGGRVTGGHSVLSAEPEATFDLNGHGTHVAGTVGSATYGMAKQVTIVPVKVIGASGTGDGADILAGIDWILANHQVGTPAVVNISLGVEGVWAPLADAVQALTDAGLFVAVAAGNGAVDACTTTPAYAPAAFTTGALTAADSRADFSNYGPCVDGFAPGEGIASLSVAGTPSYRSGTSAAAPHVAGAAALFLGQVPAATPAEVRDTLLSGAVPDVTNPGAATTNLRVTTLGLPAPGTVTNLRIQDVTTTSVVATWDPPDPVNPLPLFEYVLHAVRTATGETAGSSRVDSRHTTAAMWGLAPDTEYTFMVTAASDYEIGAPSAPVTVRTVFAPPPGTPTGLAVSMVSSSSADLAWDPPAPVDGAAVTSYDVAYRVVGKAAWTTIRGLTGHLDFTLRPLGVGLTYEATVTAVSGSVRGLPATPVHLTTAFVAPATPANLDTAAPQTSSTLAMEWEAPAVPVTGYLVQYRVASTSPWVSMSVSDTRAVRVTLTDLLPGTTYWMRVFALDGEVISAPTITLTQTTLPWAPDAPASLRVTATTRSSVSIEWSDPSAGAPVDHYAVSRAHLGAASAQSSASTLSDLHSLTLIDLQPGVRYRIEVWAIGLDGVTGPPATIDASTEFLPMSAPFDVTSSASDTTATIDWRDYYASGEPSPTSFEAQYRSTGAATWTTISTTTTSMALTALVPATTYQVRVRAIAGQERSPYSSIALVTTLPGTPVNLRLTTVTPVGAQLLWDDVPAGSRPTGHTVAYRQTGTATWTSVSTGVSSPYTLAGLTAGTEYLVRVQASVADITGLWSEPRLFVTPQRPVDPPDQPTPTERYVTAVYRDLFDRSPEVAGLAAWTAALDSGGPRMAVANSITGSAEYRSKLIDAVYGTYLGRGADPSGSAAWLAAMQRGSTVQQIEAGFIASDEYYAQAGGTSAAWVTRLYSNVLARNASAQEIASWTAGLAAGASRSQVAHGFLLSTEHLSTVVDGYYLQLLMRHIDPTGRAAWVSAIQNGSRVEEIIGGIVASDEYYARATSLR